MEKIEPIIDNPVPLNNCCSASTSPPLRFDTESNTDLGSSIDEDVADIIADIENPNITRQRININVTTEAMKYFCCFGTADLVMSCFINFSVKPGLTSSSFKEDKLSCTSFNALYFL